MEINDLEEFIEYCCSTGKTTDTTLFTREELLEIENKAAGGSDKKFEKVIRKIWKRKQDEN
jgi:hypothetical protein